MDETVKYMSDENQESGFLKSITFAIAMSLHSILEGIALGVQVLFLFNSSTNNCNYLG
jgi:zinc transporter ZupT